jgi:hypothetical protein
MAGTCVRCGLVVAVGDEFCGSCGQPVASAGTAARPAQAGEMFETAPLAGSRQWSDGDGHARGSAGRPSRNGGPFPADAGAGLRTPNGQYLSQPNEQYLGQRLLYERAPEGSFDPLSNSRLLLQFLRHLVQYIVLYFVGGFLAAVLMLFLHLVGLSTGAVVALWSVGAVLIALVLGCLFWLLPVPALLSEWKFFVEDKAAAAAVTFEHITWALGRHETPLDMIQVRRLKLPQGESRDYLELRRGLFTGFISCFAYGQDLYVGWTFYLRVSPLRWLLMALARVWQTLMRRGTDLYVTLRFDSARAMREAMHSVAREGIDVAADRVRPQGQGIVGSTMKVAVSEIDT